VICVALPVLLFLGQFVLSGCPQSGQYVGDQVCLACHDGRSGPDQREFVKGPHRSLRCESCHGPGFAHFRAGGRGGLLIENPGRAPFTATPDNCAECHEDHVTGYLGTEHAIERGASCNDCHDVHKKGGMVFTTPNNTLLARDEYDTLCKRCHNRQVDEFGQSGHTTVEAFTCGACHALHTPGNLVATPIDNTLCLRCHASFELGFDSVEAVDYHTGEFHPVDPDGSGSSRCTGCHMQPTRLEDQSDGPHNHFLTPEPPADTVQDILSGRPIRPNSCAGAAGCHDADVPGSGAPYDVFSVQDNETLQSFYEVIGGIL
jgi:predicted CXXCH cytochrome family protein